MTRNKIRLVLLISIILNGCNNQVCRSQVYHKGRSIPIVGDKIQQQPSILVAPGSSVEDVDYLVAHNFFKGVQY